MKYPSRLLQQADRVLSDRRLQAGLALDLRKAEIREHHPEIWETHRQSMQAGAGLGVALVMDCSERYDVLLQQMEESRSQVREMLVAVGLPENYLESWYQCDKCSDQGYIAGVLCDCRRQLLNRLAYEFLSNTSKVEECGFDNFDLSYYPEAVRKDMSKLLQACRRYADEFSHNSRNLFFTGMTGLGKTHLSLAIAREVVNRGRLVVYASAAQLVSRIVDSAMGDAGEDEYRDIVYGCDLLIIDDLGTEIKTHITKAEVHNLINTRINEGRPTIINTNLTVKDIESTYDQRVCSRIIGCYVVNQFSGKDIRLQRRMQK